MKDIKFEIIDGTLCRMVEPKPLTPEATFPCMVNKISRTSPLVAVGLETSGEIATIGDVNTHIKYDSCEVIGYPVEDGSAEWAWQMLNLLGLPIYHPSEGVLTIPIPYSSERFAHCYAKTGWKIHEPEPAYRVGDWVEVNANGVKKQGKIKRFCDVDFFQDNTNAFVLGDSLGRWYGYHRVEDITRKLDPSEVIVNIGCLSGTVELLTWKRAGFNLITKHGRCWILLDALDAPTRELVESLLKAQEEKW